MSGPKDVSVMLVLVAIEGRVDVPEPTGIIVVPSTFDDGIPAREELFSIEAESCRLEALRNEDALVSTGEFVSTGLFVDTT